MLFADKHGFKPLQLCGNGRMLQFLFPTNVYKPFLTCLNDPLSYYVMGMCFMVTKFNCGLIIDRYKPYLTCLNDPISYCAMEMCLTVGCKSGWL